MPIGHYAHKHALMKEIVFLFNFNTTVLPLDICPFGMSLLLVSFAFGFILCVRVCVKRSFFFFFGMHFMLHIIFNGLLKKITDHNKNSNKHFIICSGPWKIFKWIFLGNLAVSVQSFRSKMVRMQRFSSIFVRLSMSYAFSFIKCQCKENILKCSSLCSY